MPTIIVRHSEQRDIGAVKQIYEGSKAYSGTLQLPFPSFEKWEKRLSALPEGFYSLVAEVDDAVVGHIGLETMPNPRRKHAASIGMAVRETFHGQGVGSNLLRSAIDLAENWLSITRIELIVYVDNDAAIELYRRYGFETEGRLIAYAFRNGMYVDAFQMAKVRTPEIS